MSESLFLVVDRVTRAALSKPVAESVARELARQLNEEAGTRAVAVVELEKWRAKHPDPVR